MAPVKIYEAFHILPFLSNVHRWENNLISEMIYPIKGPFPLQTFPPKKKKKVPSDNIQQPLFIHFDLPKTSNIYFQSYLYSSLFRRNVICSYIKVMNKFQSHPIPFCLTTNPKQSYSEVIKTQTAWQKI